MPDAMVCPPPPRVVINEVVASNVNGLVDEDGETPDWIELYNADEMPVSLSGWGLSDDPEEPLEWVLPDLTLQPGAFLLILASDMDRDTVVSWDTRVDWGDLWRYLPVVAPPDPDWILPEFDDSDWDEGPSGFGHSDDDDATLVDAHTVYVRHTFDLSPEDRAAVTALLLDVDYDDGFVAYLNGIEVARGSMGIEGNRPAWDAFADEPHEGALHQGGVPPRYDLVNAIALLRDGPNVLALEQHDISLQSSDTTLIPFFSIGFGDGRAATPSPHLRLPNQWLHTNFKLSSGGETVVLTQPDGCEVDRVETGPLPADVSRGRTTDGDGEWGFFFEPTPGAPNETESRPQFTAAPTLSPPPGFYPQGTEVTVEHPSPTAQVHYTLDGREPGPDDPVVDGPITVGDDPAVVVIRAQAFEEGAWPSPMTTGTYLATQPSSLATISLVSEPANFWDNDTGIYVLGDTYENDVPFFGANFWEDWERPLHVEFWEPDGTPGFDLDCGVKIHGGWSRSNPQKSLRLMMRAGYGQRALEYPVFEEPGIDVFRRLILRNSGNDWHGCSERGCTRGSHLRDAVMHRIADGIDLERLRARPVMTYLNGEFWGIYNIRERSDRQLLETRYGYDAVDVLEFAGGVVDGDDEHYQELLEIWRTQDMRDPQTYARVEARVDTDNFAAYQILQIFYGNRDWPGNNIKFWRPKTEDGRWRWLLYDTDFGIGLYERDPRDNTLAFALNPRGPGWPNPPWSTEPLRSMIQSPIFAVQFINRYADYLNTLFQPERTIAILDAAAATLEAELPRQLERWGRAGGRRGPTMNPAVWGEEIEHMRNWLRARPQHAWRHLRETLQLGGTYQLDLRVEPPGSGTLQLTAVNVAAPFSGTYFRGIPITVTAIPAEGFEWSGWDRDDVPQEQTVVFTPEGNTTLTARFE